MTEGEEALMNLRSKYRET